MPPTNKQEAANQLRQLNVLLCGNLFSHFVRTFWPILEPTNPFQESWYTNAICQHLSNIQSLRRLLINIPPRHAKSLLTSVLFPAWYWVRHPETRFLCCSYKLDLAKDHADKCRKLIESPLYQDYFGKQFKLREDRNTLMKFVNNKTGYRVSTSVDSGNTGEGADIILFDDPNDVREVGSETERKKVINFWRTVLSTRLNDPTKGCRILVQQRCHPDDLSGWLLDYDPESWAKLILPMEYDPNRQARTNCTNRGWEDPRKTAGELLSNRLPPEDIAAYKRDSVSRRIWECQYNQNPKPSDGRIFRLDWFQTFTEQGENYRLGERLIAKNQCWRMISVDLAISQRAEADYTVFTVIDVTPQGDMVILHIERKQLNAARMLATFSALNATYQPHYFFVEKVAFQDFVIQYTRQQGFTVKETRPTADKLARSASLEAKMSCGQVFFPKERTGKEWIAEAENEVIEFPDGKHDDIVDTLTQAASEVGKRVKYRPEPQAQQESEEERQAKEAKQLHEAMWEDARC